jgi:hypothetical protein
MHVLAVTRPQSSLLCLLTVTRFDTDYMINILWNDRYRLDANGVEVYGNGQQSQLYQLDCGLQSSDWY